MKGFYGRMMHDDAQLRQGSETICLRSKATRQLGP